MDNFIVSARKYRPDTFSSVVGQNSITITLKNAIKNNHLAHAYLFCGPRGVGKTTCARIFAKTINCFNITSDFEACNECDSCKSFNESRSYNIHELDAASNNTVDDIRNLIEQVRIPPQVGKYSLYIIDEVHMLSASAFNAFLKTLEEPPAHAIFILATTEKHKIIPTILSRCQIFDFNRISIGDISNHLAYVAKNEAVVAESDALNVIAQKADGSLRDSLSIFDQIVSFAGNEISYKDVINNLNILDHEYYKTLTTAFLSGDISTSYLVFDEILRDGFDAHYFITGLSEYLRDLLVCKDNVTLKLLEVGDNLKEIYRTQANFCSIDFLYKALEITNKCDVSYKSAVNKRLHVEISLLELCNIQHTFDGSSAKIEKSIDPILIRKDTESTISKVETKIVSEPTNNTEIKQSSEKLIKEKSISLKKELAKNEIQTEVLVEKKEEKKEILDKELIQDDLDEVWKSFTQSIKVSEPRLNNILTQYLPTVIELNRIELKLESLLQQDVFNEAKQRILSYLKAELSNNKIDLITTVVEDTVNEDSKRLYTDNDKFNYLNEINPELSNFKQQFKLDFE
ncbi:MAG TPA: DNA polymerase III subunit gamma/tau [Bacteroidales bacterium]|nr:MAG: DNA polymerase III, subunit gamma and tau [Bacteroidetes bacterium GWF2_33_38]OFY74157.1 MAG: DNA polymerase III, subunit gamma and tau [Bacteroidetes bacterium RIFOXYA12_FULL_33_9]OFY91101.1 MAG: DNA polymerase III, subunit gamma and tau [Bacteroidetes bacterium RIFOXYA2_FULL_33_7]HBF89166.1 DNA polymerase III subunit gamma/tau [Bacteroidales bacterium]